SVFHPSLALGTQRQGWVKNAENGSPFSENGTRFEFSPAGPTAEAKSEKPFTAMLGSLRWHLGGGTRTARSARIANWNRDNKARLSPADIEALGLEEDGLVRITSDYGSVERGYIADAGLLPGRAFIPLGFSGNDAADLAGLEALKPAAPAWRTCRVDIEKI
ncbi:MAG: molybdopterin dinucleotide binding domain-containing protein, partial [Thermodesulfobacteriota bacterium]